MAHSFCRIKFSDLSKLLDAYITRSTVSCQRMKPILLLISCIIFANFVYAQESDFIVLKKKNNRTLRTYYPGAFISAETYLGFPINGYIIAIRNDSIIWRQEELRLMEAREGMGTVVDTFRVTMGVLYTHIEKFNYKRMYTWGGKRGFSGDLLPRLMMIGGVGFTVLELVNTAYRRESLNEGNKLEAMGVALGVATTGWLISERKDRALKVGKKFNVVYVKAKTL